MAGQASLLSGFYLFASLHSVSSNGQQPFTPILCELRPSILPFPSSATFSHTSSFSSQNLFGARVIGKHRLNPSIYLLGRRTRFTRKLASSSLNHRLGLCVAILLWKLLLPTLSVNAAAKTPAHAPPPVSPVRLPCAAFQRLTEICVLDAVLTRLFTRTIA